MEWGKMAEFDISIQNPIDLSRDGYGLRASEEIIEVLDLRSKYYRKS
jgi:hypothetical protein